MLGKDLKDQIQQNSEMAIGGVLMDGRHVVPVKKGDEGGEAAIVKRNQEARLKFDQTCQKHTEEKKLPM